MEHIQEKIVLVLSDSGGELRQCEEMGGCPCHLLNCEALSSLEVLPERSYKLNQQKLEKTEASVACSLTLL